MPKKKTNDRTVVPVPDAETPPAIPVDEYHGMGGSYVIDPATGKRVRIAGPDSARPAEQPETEQPPSGGISQ